MQALRDAAVRLKVPYAVGGVAGASLIRPAVEPAEVRIVRHHADVIHRVGVAGQRHPAFVLGAGRLLAGDELRGLVRGDVKALDRDRALGRACPNLPAQAAEPEARATGLGAEAPAQLLELVELGS